MNTLLAELSLANQWLLLSLLIIVVMALKKHNL